MHLNLYGEGFQWDLRFHELVFLLPELRHLFIDGCYHVDFVDPPYRTEDIMRY